MRVWVGVAIFGFALVLRLLGIGWGLGNDLHFQSYHPDEPVVWAYSQQIEPAKLQFTPGFYNYGTLYLTMVRVATDVTAAYSGGPDPQQEQSVWAFLSRAHLAGRLLSAVAGAVTALLLFLMGARLFGTWGGIAAALFIAVAPAHVVHSRFQTVDIVATALIAASAFFALRLLPRDEISEEGPPKGRLQPEMRLALLSGLFAGLSAGTKYTGILVLLTLYVALALSKRKDWLKLAAAGSAVAAAAFVVTTPGILLQTDQFVRDFVYEMRHTSTGHGLIFEGTSPAFVYHLSNLFAGIGLLLTLLGLGGLIYAGYRRQPWALALLVFFVLYYVLIGRAEVKFLRYTFPLYIALAVGFGYAMTALQQNTGWRRFGVALGILAIGGLDMGGLVGASKATTWMLVEDPRDQASRWVRQQSHEGTTVGYARDPWFWSVPFFPYATAVRAMRFGDRMESMAQASNPRPVLYVSPEGGAPDFDSRLLTQLRPEYVTITTLEAGHLERLRRTRAARTPEARAALRDYESFMLVLERDYQPVRMFGEPAPEVEDFQYIQPQVVVYQRKEQ
jgi:hypothetical protein